jgi:large subunit ribosomal protein L1
MQKRARDRERMKKKKRQARFKEYKYATPSKAEQFSLCDAMRCVALEPIPAEVRSKD